MHNDAMQRIKTVNAASDDGVIYYLRGDSINHRRPDWHPAKVELPPDAKKAVLDVVAQSGGTKTLYDALVSRGYVEPLSAPEIDTSDDEALKKLTLHEAGEYLSASEFERWRQLQGQKTRPTYVPIMPQRK